MSPASQYRPMPPVSIVIPCFNSGGMVAGTIVSALNQSYRDVEIIAVNDGSTDGTLAVLQLYSDRIIVENGPNRGSSGARNRGMALVSGEYVLFLDADDYIEPETIASMVEAAGSVDADIIFAPFAFEWPNGKRDIHEPGKLLGGTTPVQVLDGWINRSFVPPVAILWRSQFLQCLGGWSERCIPVEDAELVFRALLREPTIAFSANGLGVYVQHDSPDRLSKQMSIRAIRSRMEVWRDLSRRIEDTPFDVAKPGLGLRFYHLARKACVTGMPSDVVETALYEARRCGLAGHPGTWPHAIMASIIGLQNKEKLSAAIRRFL
jgi:glycosyltransferase involved in cell wall biosynthesis